MELLALSSLLVGAQHTQHVWVLLAFDCLDAVAIRYEVRRRLALGLLLSGSVGLEGRVGFALRGHF